jgi:folate-binding protein YgfZ
MVIDLSDRTKFRVTGTDRLRYFNGQLTNDLRELAPGAALYACALTPKGKLAGDLYIAADTESFWIDAPSTLRESLLSRLERYIIADDVSIIDKTDDYRLLHFLNENPPEVEESIQSKSKRFGSEGVDVLLPITSINQLLTHLKLLGSDEIERLRIERGIPAWGAELSEEILPAEAGLDETAISFTKGCYLGQEVISRIKSVGHVNRHLRGFRWVSGPSLNIGDQLFSADNLDKAIGVITSVASGKPPIALGYVRRGFDEPGKLLKVKASNNYDLIGSIEITSLPFRSV